jgi:hypothetical protein
VSKYVPSWVFATEFDGDQLHITLAPLERGDALRIGEIKATVSAADPQEQQRQIGVQFTALWAELLPKYVKSITGLRDANGNAISLEVVGRDTYFSMLVAKIGWELLNKARPDFTLPGSPVAESLPGSPSIQTPASVVSA